MKTEIPAFLLEMSKQMNKDDKRCTAHPFWQVRNKEYVVTEEGYNEHHFEICGDDGCIYRSDIDKDYDDLAYDLLEESESWCIEWLQENVDSCEDLSEQEFSREKFRSEFCENFDPDIHDLPSNYKRVFMQEIDVVLTTHMTQADAEWFINRKKHDYPNAYTYVESAYWSPQLKQLQDWIKGLTNISEQGE